MKKEIDEAAQKEAEETQSLISQGKYSPQHAQARARGIYLASIPLLFVMVGLISGLAGSLFSGVIFHFIEAGSKSPLAPGNRVWTGIGLFCFVVVLYVGMWANRVQKLYRAKAVGTAKGAGLNLD